MGTKGIYNGLEIIGLGYTLVGGWGHTIRMGEGGTYCIKVERPKTLSPTMAM